MKKLIQPQFILFFLWLFGLSQILAQDIIPPSPISVPFDVVPNSTFTINGELKLIANAIVGPNQTLKDENGIDKAYTPNDNYNGFESNTRKVMGYIDIDEDPTTFSSSSANFISANTGCAKIVYAGLYWSASYYIDRTNLDGTAQEGDLARYENLPFPDNRPDFRTIKFKPPGVENYIDIPASSTTVIFDGYRNSSTNPGDIAVQDIPYACYTDVTDIVKGLSNPEGTYTVANMRAATGRSANNSSGISGGWALVLVYEDLNLPKSYINTNQGFVEVSSTSGPETFTYSGFKSAPAPLPVNARYGVAGLEGDLGLVGDRIAIKGVNDNYISLEALPVNPINDFFNSSISTDGNYASNRIPASRNTLGFDADIFNIFNPNNQVIGNNQNSVQFRITTNSDRYRLFLNTFQVEVIEPKLAVEKRVLDINENDITGGDVTLNDAVIYELKIENIGNEDLTNTSIKISLPQEVDFTSNNVTADPGINYVFDPTTREFLLTLDDTFVERFDGPLFFRYRVNITSDCFSVVDSCNGEIESVAFSSYTGRSSSIEITEQQNTFGRDDCNNTVEGSASVFLDLSSCNDVTAVSLCNGSVNLVAQDGFTSYEWIDVNNPDIILGGNQIFIATQPGLYQVTKTSNSDCQNTIERFEVTSLDVINNPIITIIENLENNPVATGNIKVCPTTGGSLPEIFLCGAATSLDLDLGFVNALDVQWERLDPSACPSVNRDPNCPTTDPICEADWVTVRNEPVFTASQAGEYRIQVNLDGGCIRTFYFNVFQNNFDPQLVVVEPITCGNPGMLEVANASIQHEYQLVAPDGSTSPYQTDNLFKNIIIPGAYTINARPIGGAQGSCIFPSNTVIVEEIEILVAIETIDPICSGDLGEIHVSIINDTPPFIYRIFNSDTSIEQLIGPINTTDYKFTGLPSGTYNLEVITLDSNCFYNETVSLTEPIAIDAEVSLVKELSCVPSNENAVINLSNITGGSGAYKWSLDPLVGFSEVTSDPFEISVNTAGTYTIYILDSITGCTFTLSNVFVNPLETIDDINVEVKTQNCEDQTSQVIFNAMPSLTAGEFYEYSISPNPTNNTDSTPFSTLNAYEFTGGIVYTITARRSDNGCTFAEDFVADPINPIEITEIVSNGVTCNGLTDGTIEFTANSTNYKYEVNDVTGSFVTDGTSSTNATVISGLVAAPYAIMVIDLDSNCIVTEQITVAQPPILQASILEVFPETCTADSDGVVKFEVTGGTPPYETNITNNDADFVQNTFTYTNLPAGTTVIFIRDTNNCRIELPVNIIEAEPLFFNTTITPVTSDASGSIDVEVTGGTAPYSYELRNPAGEVIVAAQSDNKLEVDIAGNYVVAVTDVNGCSTSLNITVEGLQETPLLEYADEIFFCTITGQSYPVVTIQDTDGEILEIPPLEQATIVWQKLSDITCTEVEQDNCPTTDSSCSSSWFDIAIGTTGTINEEGQYRIVITFITKNGNNTIIYYFKAEKEIKDIRQSFAMYPNPAKGTVQVNSDVKSIAVFDVMGKMVIQSYQNSYDVASLRNGVYFVKVITTNDQEIITKLIKE